MGEPPTITGLPLGITEVSITVGAFKARLGVFILLGLKGEGMPIKLHERQGKN